MSGERLLAWLVRVAWAALVPAAGPGFADALDERSRDVQIVASIGLWAAWTIVLCATFVRHPVSLTVLRVGAVWAVVAAAIAGGAAWPSALAGGVVVIIAMWPGVALLNVNGPAYPNERRFPLRPPGPLLFGPLPLAALAVVGGPAAGALLLAASQWVLGGIVLVLGAGAAVVAGRALHGLSRRWVVFVPAGLVVHDPTVLADPILFRRQLVVAVAPALQDTDAFDLTARALGIALQVDLAEPVGLALARVGSRAAAETVEATAFLVAPTRPGAVIAEAAKRRIG